MSEVVTSLQVAARLSCHWALQAPTALASRLVPKQEDDSHSNFGWHEESAALVSHRLAELSGLRDTRVGLRPEDLTLVVLVSDLPEAEVRLPGLTLEVALERARAALRERAGETLPDTPMRDYEMPAHPVGVGGSFDTPTAEAGELAQGFARFSRIFDEVEKTVSLALSRQAPASARSTLAKSRVWPHHFDLGGLISIPTEPARWVGYGWSPGDHSFEQPYLYVNPYPPPAVRPTHPASHVADWHDQPFSGFVIHQDDLEQRTDADVAGSVIDLVEGLRTALD